MLPHNATLSLNPFKYAEKDMGIMQNEEHFLDGKHSGRGERPGTKINGISTPGNLNLSNRTSA